MYESNAFVKSELAYRAGRVRTGLAGRRRSHVRIPFVRRPAEASENAR
jgi:hypothetical protein